MSDIPTGNLDAEGDSPKQARGDLLEAVNRVNALTRSINTAVAELLSIENNLSVTGDAGVLGKFTLAGTLNFGTGQAGTAGQALTSQGDGQPSVWADQTGAKYQTSSTTSLTLDTATPKAIVVAAKLSYTVGQGIAVANDAGHVFIGTVASYDPVTGNLSFNNTNQLGTGTFASWTVNLTGATGTVGAKGDQGDKGDKGDTGTGTAGAAGSQIFTGAGVPSSGQGANGDFYINTTNGDYYTKAAGAWSLQGNLTGPQGPAGGGSTTIYDTISRYQSFFQTGVAVTSVTSSASIKSGVSWARTGTSLVITDNGHGRSVGEFAIVRNTNVSYQDGLITAADTNTYTITCANTGGTVGTAGAYSMGFTFAFVGAVGSITGLNIIAPANYDCVLLGVRFHLGANTRATTTLNITVPKGNINGVGPQTSMDAITIPNQAVRGDSNTLSAVGATLAVNLSGDFGVYQFAALGVVTSGCHVLMNF